MKQRFKHTFILGILFILIANFFVSSYIPVHAANTDVNKDKDRRSIKALRDCMDKSVIDEDDDIDNYSDVFDDTGRKELIVVGFDMSDNGVIACTSAVRLGLKAMGLGSSNAEVEKYFIEYITGENYVAGQTIRNDSKKMLANMDKLKALAQAAYSKTESPSDDLKREQIAPLVNKCFTADTGSGSDYSADRGDFKVDGLGTFQQKDKLKVSSFSWLKFDKNHNTYKVGDLPLNFVDFNQNGSDGSTDFYPFRSDISETSSYKNDAVVDCHFIAKNKDWIFDKNVTIKDGKAVFTNSSGEVIDTGTDNADIGAEEDEPSCAATSTNPLSWGICPIVNGLGDLTDWLFSSFILPLLKTSPLVVKPNTPIFNVWSGFRLIANIMLVIVFIIMIFGQAIGGGLVDAYTAKKVIPRVVIGAIGINLSIYISAILVDITNVIGNGIGLLIVSPFLAASGSSSQEYKPGGLSSVIALVIVILTVAGLGIAAKNYKITENARTNAKRLRKSAFGGVLKSALSFILLFIGIPVAIAAISIFVTLILRTGIILLFSVVSPIAIALWMLPSTEKYFNKWLSLFIKALLVYPIIVVLFAMGDVLAYAFGGNMLNNPDPLGINGVIAIFAQFIPLFMIGFAFKIAGGIIGGIHEAVLKRGKQTGEFIKGNDNDPDSLRRRTRHNLADKTTQVRERAVKAGRADGASNWARGLAKAANYGNLQARRSRFNKEKSEMMQAQIATGDDSNIRDMFIAQDRKGDWYRRMDMEKQADGSLVARAGVSRLYDPAAGKAAHAKAMSLYGGDKSAFQDGLYYEWKKTSFDSGQMGQIEDQYGDILAEHGLSDFEGTEAMKAVGFRHQNQSLVSKYRSFKDGKWKTDHVGMAKEAALNRGSYPMSQQDVRTFDEMGAGWVAMGRSLATVDPQASDDTIIASGEYKGKSVGDLKQARKRIADIASELNPRSQTASSGQTIPQGEVDGEPVMSGYGGITGAPVEVRDAAQRLHKTIYGEPAPAGPQRPMPGQVVAGQNGAPGSPVVTTSPSRGGEMPGDVTDAVAGLSGGRTPTAPPAEPQRPAGAPYGLGDNDPNDTHDIG